MAYQHCYAAIGYRPPCRKIVIREADGLVMDVTPAAGRSYGLSLVFVRKATTALSQAACGAHRQHMAAMRRAGEKRLCCLLSHG